MGSMAFVTADGIKFHSSLTVKLIQVKHALLTVNI